MTQSPVGTWGPGGREGGTASPVACVFPGDGEVRSLDRQHQEPGSLAESRPAQTCCARPALNPTPGEPCASYCLRRWPLGFPVLGIPQPHRGPSHAPALHGRRAGSHRPAPRHVPLPTAGTASPWLLPTGLLSSCTCSAGTRCPPDTWHVVPTGVTCLPTARAGCSRDTQARPRESSGETVGVENGVSQAVTSTWPAT